MNDTGATYQSPLSGRYASTAMKQVFSSLHVARQWRRLWLWLAESEAEMGLPISEGQLASMRAHLDDVDLADIAVREGELRHDVMAHLHSFGALAPDAKPIMHWGATSAFIQDNADILVSRAALSLVKAGLVDAIDKLSKFAREWSDQPCLGYTHFQSAQPTTVGKRATLWVQDFLLDLADLEYIESTLSFRGVKGTTGTQASFLTLFEGDHEKVRELDRRVVGKAGFERSIAVSGQTITRKQDARVAAMLSGIAQSASKFGNDMRLLQHLGEIEEPFQTKQIGSSAMPHKRNPMRMERVGALARFAIATSQNPAYTVATQWLERTLDDSANRRLAMSEIFLTVDSILQLVRNVAGGLVVHPKRIEANLRRELPFLITETILMEAVKKGADRQKLHEKIRVHARAASDALKDGAERNDLLDRLEGDPDFAGVQELLTADGDLLRWCGRASLQVEEFLADEVDAVVRERSELLGGDAEVRV